MTCTQGPMYRKALSALQAAHDACFNAPGRDVLGMSSGPFSGVNVVLGMIEHVETMARRTEMRERMFRRDVKAKPRPIRAKLKFPIKNRGKP